MGEVELGSITSGALASADALQLGLVRRLREEVPEVVDEAGNVNWGHINDLALPLQVGKTVMVFAVPELANAYAAIIADKEATGHTDDAIRVYEQSERAKRAAVIVLGVATDALYTDEGDTVRTVIKQADQEPVLIKYGDQLREVADALLVRMQEEPALCADVAFETPDDEKEYITAFAADFVNNMVNPASGLIRTGFRPATAIAIVDLADELNSPVDEVVTIANTYYVDLNDETDRAKLAAASRYAGGLQYVKNHINNLGEISQAAIEGITPTYVVAVTAGTVESTAEGDIVPALGRDDEEAEEFHGADWGQDEELAAQIAREEQEELPPDIALELKELC